MPRPVDTMLHSVELLVIVLMTLMCVCFLILFGMMANLHVRRKEAATLLWPNALWFFGFVFAGMLLSTGSFYLRYFGGWYRQSSVADICSAAGFCLYALGFYLARKHFQALIAANGGTIWTALASSQRQLWHTLRHRGRA